MGLINLLRLGESKIHSTIRFEGCFCVFKKDAFDKFDESGADDSGTALKVVQKGFRAILVPEIFAFSEIPNKLGDRIKVKMRRAIHLNGLWFQCLRLLLKGCLMLPKRIAVPEIFISILNPIIFIALACVTLVLVVSYPIALIPLIMSFFMLGLIPKIRNYFVHGILDQFILFYSIVYCISRKRIVAWDK
ncbi:MAG: glycosyltransferase family 2 protein [Candidatus Helarchaeota archaeon]